MPAALSIAAVLVLTVLSGLLDARGFLHASRAWPQGSIDWGQVARALLAFCGGISLYILAVRFMQDLGVGSAALQTALWFFVTVVAIAVFDGSFVQWTRPQQTVGIGLGLGLAWLLVSTARPEL